MKYYSIIFLITLSCLSCSDNIEDELIGEWKLFKTNSDCSQNQEFEDEETFANDGCIIQTIVSNSGLSTDLDFC